MVELFHQTLRAVTYTDSIDLDDQRVFVSPILLDRDVPQRGWVRGIWTMGRTQERREVGESAIPGNIYSAYWL